MATVDNRVVSITFDNAQFQRKMEETIKSLDKLRGSLDMSNSQKSMEGLNATAGKFSVGAVSQGIEGVSAKFLALSTIGVTALSTIASKAMQVGSQVVKAFAIEPIMDGFKEYETQLNSVQTILANTASKGTSLDQVNEALQKLNVYSDQTIYNFGQMAKNIGTFTAAGVDLDTSVASIKGIANIAAMSGSSAEQASTAMYQLSQAIAAGSVKLMDWNSVVNAGMGGEALKSALFETGKAMGKLKDVPMGQTFKQWEDSGHSFRESLQDGWVTADVLTTTLSAFTGDMTEEMLLQKGFNQQQASAILKQAAIAKAAATEVKTFTQLLGTVKEAVGTGWADSFKIIIGNFTEAKALWTGVNNSIGNFISKSSDARNALLQGWKDMGGRTVLIEALKTAFTGIGNVLKTIGKAFKEVFPPTTAKTLFELTQRFSDFTQKLLWGEETLGEIKNTFIGFFSVLKIGMEIVKGVGRVLKALGDAVVNLFSHLLQGSSGLGLFLQKWEKILVEGGGIENFFDKIVAKLVIFGEWTAKVSDWIAGMFKGGVPGAEGASEVVGRVGDRMESLSNATSKVGAFFKAAWAEIQNFADKVGPKIKEMVDQVKGYLKNFFKPGDFNTALDILNTGLLVGIGLLIRKWFKKGFSLDLTGGLLDKVGGVFDQLTSSLKTLQQQVKTDMLMKIAKAILLLTASIFVLSLIDSAALAKALTAMAVGFGELVAAFAVLDQMSGTTGTAKMIGLAFGLGLLAGAMLILSLAVKVLSTMSMDEIARGIAGIAGMLTVMIVAIKPLTSEVEGMIKAGIGMAAIGVGLLILSLAVRSFAGIAWDDMLHGFVGVGVGLGIIAGAMHLMPSNMAFTGAGILLVAVGMVLLAKAVESFGSMDLNMMGKGMLGIGAALVVIAGAMHLMPKDLLLTAAGLLVVGVALNVIARAVGTMGGMNFDSMKNGIAGLAAVMLILVIAVNLMNGALAGAAALVIVSGALWVLSKVLLVLGGMQIEQLVMAIAALAAVFVVIGLAALILQPLIPALLGLGVALALVGAGIALFGAGAFLLSLAFIGIAKAGEAGTKALVGILETLVAALPNIMAAFAEGLINMAKVIISAVPMLIDGLKIVLLALLDMIIEIAPKIAEAIVALVLNALVALRAIFPVIVQTAIDLLIALLTGIRDNIGQVATLGIEILAGLVNALAENIWMITNAATNLIISFVESIAANIFRIVDAGVDILVQFLFGLARDLYKITEAVSTLITTFITEVGKLGKDIAKAGADAIVDFLDGFDDDIQNIINKGGDVIIHVMEGFVSKSVEVANKAAELLVQFLDGLSDAVDTHADEIRTAALKLANAIINGLTGGLSDKAGEVADSLTGVLGDAWDKGMSFIGARSPSREYKKMGGYIVAGLANGLDNADPAIQSMENLTDDVMNSFKAAMATLPTALENMDEFDLAPAIVPVLDLSGVQRDAKEIGNLVSANTVAAQLSYDNANLISHTTDVKPTEAPTPPPVQPQEITFEQNNYSPKALSVNDIYRNTRSQITLAKEALAIP